MSEQSTSGERPATPTQAGVLADGTAPATPDDFFRRLDSLAIATRTISHPPVFTVEEAKTLRGQIEGGHTKNLFLRNKKGKMWLVTCLEDRQVDLKALDARLDSGRLSFASAERLMKYLGVIPGAVTPFALMNDTTGAVQAVLDKGMVEDYDVLNFHPLDNAMTTTIEPHDLVSFLKAVGHPPEFLDFSAIG